MHVNINCRGIVRCRGIIECRGIVRCRGIAGFGGYTCGHVLGKLFCEGLFSGGHTARHIFSGRRRSCRVGGAGFFGSGIHRGGVRFGGKPFGRGGFGNTHIGVIRLIGILTGHFFIFRSISLLAVSGGKRLFLG